MKGSIESDGICHLMKLLRTMNPAFLEAAEHLLVDGEQQTHPLVCFT